MAFGATNRTYQLDYDVFRVPIRITVTHQNVSFCDESKGVVEARVVYIAGHEP